MITPMDYTADIQDCPYCGGGAEVLQETVYGEFFCMVSCMDPDCPGWNRKLYDDIDKACEAWNK